MSAEMSTALFTAILSMDAYNRGYLPQVGGLSDAAGTQIGNAKINFAEGDEASGFYAISYSYQGQTVISFRGTDNLNILDSANDILNGWLTGVGALTTQSALAEQFYLLATGTSVFSGPDNNVLLTGHSLGGGLAGYIASLAGDSAYVFDNMPYAAAALNRAIAENISLGMTAFSGFLDGQTAAGFAPLPNASRITSISTTGEILSAGRLAALTAGSVVETAAATTLFAQEESLLGATADGITAAAEAVSIQSAETASTLSSYAGVPSNPINLHSVSLLVLLQYASDNKLTYWQSIGPELYNAYFDDSIGTAIGVLPGSAAGPAAQMLTEIAYSAINSGVMPFGNTGIQALFHDADEMGQLYGSGSAGYGIGGVGYAVGIPSIEFDLTEVVVEYAGYLAKNSDTISTHASGIVTYDSANDSLTFNLSAQAWSIGGVMPSSIVGEISLLSDLASNSLAPTWFASADYVSPKYGKIVFGTSDSATHTINLSSDTGNDLVISDNGTDTIVTGIGKTDVIAGTGTVTIDASSLTSSGVVQLQAGVGSDNLLLGSSGTVVIDNPLVYSGTISHFVVGDTIDLAGIAVTNATIDGSGHLSVTTASGSLSFTTASGATAQKVFLYSDGNGGTDLTLTEGTSVTTVPGSQTVAVGTTTPITGVSVAVPTGAALNEAVTVVLSDNIGLLSASQVAGGSVTGAGSKSMTLSGSVSAVDAELNTLSYNGPTTGNDTINISTKNDLGTGDSQQIDVTNSGTYASITFDYFGPLFTGPQSGETFKAGNVDATITFKDLPVNYTGQLEFPVSGSLTAFGLTTSDISVPQFGFISGTISSWYIYTEIYTSNPKGLISTPIETATNPQFFGGTSEDSASQLSQGPTVGGYTTTPGTWMVEQATLACFVAGTCIRTSGGEKFVEKLTVGDIVQTVPGSIRPIKWLGHRTIDCHRHPKPHDVWPVRIATGAFGPLQPHRDLWLSPDHAVFIEGALIPIKQLINGATVVQELRDEVTYWHVELEQHDVLLAEGLPCESYLDTGNRAMFVNCAVAALHPSFGRTADGAWTNDACAPLIEDGPALEAAQAHLAARAAEMGLSLPCIPAVEIAAPGPVGCVRSRAKRARRCRVGAFSQVTRR